MNRLASTWTPEEAATMPRPPSTRAPAPANAARPVPSHYSVFDSPEHLASDARISPGVREWLLGEWAEDLMAELRASDENMASDEPGRAGDLLRRVHVCLERLAPPDSSH
jgi:hypothetical protein